MSGIAGGSEKSSAGVGGLVKIPLDCTVGRRPCHNMVIAVDWGVKQQINQTNIILILFTDLVMVILAWYLVQMIVLHGGITGAGTH